MVVLSFLPCVRAYGLFFCGLLSGGVVIAYGADFSIDRHAVLPFFGGGARVGVELRLTRRLAMGLHADLLALLFTRAVLEVDDQVLFGALPVLRRMLGAQGFRSPAMTRKPAARPNHLQ